ncbi:MAG: 4Fe-4S binding protein, partial [Candidatus Moraniibacteriota bacterium]
MNVSKTRKLNLCVSCEACKAVCPVGAIEMEFSKGQYLPMVNEKKCINCEQCYKICPGINIDKDNISNKKFNVFDIAGCCELAYIVSYKNKEVRKKGASGGVVSGLLIEILRGGY